MTELESWYTPEVGQWRGTADLASWKQTASGDLYWQVWRKMHWLDQLATYQVPRDMLICSSNETSSGTNSCNCSHHLVKVIIINCHSPRSICPLHRQNRWVKWECDGNHHPCNFQVLDGGTNVSNLSRNGVLLWVTIFLHRNSPSGFHLLSPTIIVLTPQVREPMWGFYQLLNTHIPIIHSRTGKIITRWVAYPSGSL